VFIPVSWALHFAKVDDTIVFVMAFLAIIPLAKLLGFATEELALRVGQTLGGLLNVRRASAYWLVAYEDC
jgi:Ca2+:H+ antiporter